MSNTDQPVTSSTGRIRTNTESVERFGAWTAVIAFIVYHINIVYQIYESTWELNAKEVTWYLIITNILLLCAVGLLSRDYTKKSKQLKASQAQHIGLRQQIDRKKTIHSTISHRLESVSAGRTGITDHLIAVFSGSVIDKNELEHKTYNFMQMLLTNVERIFSEYTGHDCAACIKLFLDRDPFTKMTTKDHDPSLDTKTSDAKNRDTKTLIMTLLRDNACAIDRKAKSDPHEPYEYYRNLAFTWIRDQENKENFFVSNDLKNMIEYVSGRKGWEIDYNATAVVPINDPSSKLNTTIIGFLCVDNKFGEFDDEFTVNTLSIFANTLYYVLSSTYVILRSQKDA